MNVGHEFGNTSANFLQVRLQSNNIKFACNTNLETGASGDKAYKVILMKV